MLIKDAKLIPDWLKENLAENCPYCSTPYHVGYSPNGLRVTKHYCPNKECIETLVMKAVFTMIVLGIPNIKEGKSRSLIKSLNIKRHLDIIPHILSDKPSISLSTFMRINCIEGIDSAWNSVCSDKYSLEALLEDSFVQNKLTIDEIDSVKESYKHFNLLYDIKQSNEAVLDILVIMTGDILGLKNREDLISALNLKYDGLLKLRYSNTIRKTGVHALIKEKGSVITKKIDIAMSCGIPIYTPEEFIVHVDKLIQERVNKKI